MADSSLWKPTADASTGHSGSVFISESNLGKTVKIYDADTHAVIATGHFDKVYSNDGTYKGGYIYRFNVTGKNISKSTNSAVLVGEDGQYYWLGDAQKRGNQLQQTGVLPAYKEGEYSDGNKFNLDAVQRKESGNWEYTDDSESNVSGIPGVGHVAKPELLDPNLNQQTQISDTQIEFTDPLSTLREIAKENRTQIDENIIKSMEYAGKLSEANTQQLIEYLDKMSPYQRQLIEIENAFNQKEKLKAAETAIPGVTDMLRGELKNAQTLASGRLLKDSEDRALEQVSRSAGADAAWTRGLGDDSLVGKTLSDQLSVNQRQQVMAQGQNYLSQALNNAVGVLMDTPQKATMGSQIPAQPSQTVADIALAQQQVLNNATTMDPAQYMNAYINQRQAQAQMDYNTKVTNAGLQESYIQRGIDIAASNIQAMNNYNQNVLNDQTATQAAQNQAQNIRYLDFAKTAFKLSDEEYQRLKEQIEAGYGVDWATLGHQKKGNGYNFYDDYKKWRGDERFHNPETENATPQTNPDQDGSGGSSGQGSGQGGGSSQEGSEQSGSSEQSSGDTKALTKSYVEGEQGSNSFRRTAVIHDTAIYKTGYDLNKVVQSDGTITIPDANATFVNIGNLSTLEFISLLTSKDVGGIV